MLNHALSLAEFTDFKVDFIGYQGSSMTDRVNSYPDLSIVYINTSIIDKLKSLPKIFYLFYAVIRIVI